MNIEAFSDRYKVRLLTEADAGAVFELCKNNTIYYKYCPPFVTVQSVLADMKALPPRKTAEDKYYIGFYEEKKLTAVMDFIDDYPEPKIAFIGFFMTDVSVQNKGLGTEIISCLCDYLTALSYSAVRLCWVKGNPQAEHFWMKNYFVPVSETKSSAADRVIMAERRLLRT
ncbi:MAG: GNAT family N-acetyltransferase [Lachnospiraceae bacterium]|nr:GNAT family N-acetyltransferase [Lachnospiraceae bacterium]